MTAAFNYIRYGGDDYTFAYDKAHKNPASLTEGEIKLLFHDELEVALRKIVEPMHGRKPTEQEVNVIRWIRAALADMALADEQTKIQKDHFEKLDKLAEEFTKWADAQWAPKDISFKETARYADGEWAEKSSEKS